MFAATAVVEAADDATEAATRRSASVSHVIISCLRPAEYLRTEVREVWQNSEGSSRYINLAAPWVPAEEDVGLAKRSESGGESKAHVTKMSRVLRHRLRCCSFKLPLRAALQW